MYKIVCTAALAILFFVNLNGQSMDYVFRGEEIMKKSSSNDSRYYEFIRSNALHCGIYNLKKGVRDEQQPHELDELYYVIEGESKFMVASEEFDVVAGDVIYVPAHLEHRFFDMREDLKLLVFFSEVQISKTDNK